jgi:DNA-binding response OmpR family regulator
MDEIKFLNELSRLEQRIKTLACEVSENNKLIKKLISKRKNRPLTELEEYIYNLIKERTRENPISEMELCQKTLGFTPEVKEKTAITIHISRIRIKTNDSRLCTLRGHGYYYKKDGSNEA